jgi:hypothetical protein
MLAHIKKATIFELHTNYAAGVKNWQILNQRIILMRAKSRMGSRIISNWVSIFLQYQTRW